MSAYSYTSCPQCYVDNTEGVGSYALREDYEFYNIENGVLHVDYQAYCRDCGWRFSFNRSVDVVTKKETTR